MIRITSHTARQMEVRGIALAWIEATVAAPERREPDPIAGRVRLFRAIPAFGGRVMRVVVEAVGADVQVITVHFDRAATKRRKRP